jgi:hypothetical protein
MDCPFVPFHLQVKVGRQLKNQEGYQTLLVNKILVKINQAST